MPSSGLQSSRKFMLLNDDRAVKNYEIALRNGSQLNSNKDKNRKISDESS